MLYFTIIVLYYLCYPKIKIKGLANWEFLVYVQHVARSIWVEPAKLDHLGIFFALGCFGQCDLVVIIN